MTPPHNHRPDEHETDAWLAGLSGQHQVSGTGAGGGSTPAMREGALLRQLLTAQASRLQSTTGPDSAQAEAHWARVLLRVRAAHSLPATAIRPSAAGWQQRALGAWSVWTQRPASMALVGVAVIGVAVALIYRPEAPIDPTEEATLLRGDEAAIRLTVPAGELDPLSRRITALLDKHKVTYSLKRLSNGAQIQAKLAPASVAAQELMTLGIAVPPHGRLNLLVVSQ